MTKQLKRVEPAGLFLACLVGLLLLTACGGGTPPEPADRGAVNAPAHPANPAGPTARPPTRVQIANGLQEIAVAELPPEADRTLELIARGGPYPYRQDGQVFENREKLLPLQPSGYYREFTVVTSGSDDRGARRIVVGQKGEHYYTDDHYSSFKRIVFP
jgi:ribonuclease T1